MNAYSEDLRKKVVEAVIERQMPKKGRRPLRGEPIFG
jgi:hypothetical protein